MFTTSSFILPCVGQLKKFSVVSTQRQFFMVPFEPLLLSIFINDEKFTLIVYFFTFYFNTIIIKIINESIF